MKPKLPPLLLVMVSAVIMWVIAAAWPVVPEERALQAAFGQEFTAYKAAVRRWL